MVKQPGTRNWWRVGRWAGVAAGFLAVISYLGISLVSANILTRPRNHPVDLDPKLVSADASAWSIRTRDEVTLRGWYLPTEGHRRLVVMVHGMGESWDRMAGLGHDLHEKGYDVLLFDLRGHGRSDPHRLTMGRREREDIRSVLGWARAQGFTPDRIGWIGRSMGGSILLMEAAENPEIRMAVLDSPFGDLPALLDRQLTRHSHLPKAFNPGIVLAAHRVYGVRTDDLVPIDSARRWGDRPMLLIHGEADSIVPVEQSRQLARRVGAACRSVFLPDVDHVRAYQNDRRSYVALVDGFLDDHLTR